MDSPLIGAALELGADRAALLPVEQIPFEASFRSLCEQNSCGKYGTCWMCPPLVGPIEPLMARARTYSTALVYQSIGHLEDSYDFEGMMATAKAMNQLCQRIRDRVEPMLGGRPLYLGAGACLLCPRCAALDQQPCRFPDRAMPSLESYGVNVSALAPLCGMKYINGPNTVTYFGAVLFETGGDHAPVYHSHPVG